MYICMYVFMYVYINVHAKHKININILQQYKKLI